LDWAGLLTNSQRSALLAWLSDMPRRIGHDRDGRGWLLTDRVPVRREAGRIAPTRMVDYYGPLARALGCPRPKDRLRRGTIAADDWEVDRRLSAVGVAAHHPLVVMTPGASFGPSKYMRGVEVETVFEACRVPPASPDPD
jgi:heptosyltransferase-2